MTHVILELGLAEIRQLLPHRPPFLMPTRIRVEVPGRAGMGEVLLDSEDPIWDAWTSRDIGQELVLESAAQVLGVVLAKAEPANEMTEDGSRRLLGFDQVAYHTSVDPSTPLRIAVCVEGTFGSMCRGTFTATQDESVVASGALLIKG